MRKPKAEEPRSKLYLVNVIDTLGEYVGETTDKVVLALGQGNVRGYDWAHVEPVVLKATE
ncbi:MAG TPA: hypothetical protein VFH56_14240 [Acidimicrobiales bacterium]|nr:hypothetical protein [Acidimicrobiales bacterium]